LLRGTGLQEPRAETRDSSQGAVALAERLEQVSTTQKVTKEVGRGLEQRVDRGRTPLQGECITIGEE